MGEMDASGTVVAISLLGETNLIDPSIVRNTLEIYMENLNKRINSTSTETNHSAYELRVVEPMIRTGMIKEAHQVLEFFLEGQRRKAWNQWPEITWKDPSLPTGIGDMPHSWIGSEYAKAVRSLFIIENLEKSELIIGPGILEKWLQVKDKIGVDKLPTPYGLLRYALNTNRRVVNGDNMTIFSTLEVGLKQQWNIKKNESPSISLRSPPHCIILKVNTQEPSAQIERTQLTFKAKSLTAQIQFLCSTKNQRK